MKKLLFTILSIIFVCLTGISQEVSKYRISKEKFTDNSYSVVQSDTTLNPQKFLNAKQWAIKTFADYKDVIQMEDATNGRLVIKGILPVQAFYGQDVQEYYSPFVNFTLTIDIKPDKYRFKFENMSVKVLKEIRLGMMTHKSESDMTMAEYMEWDSGARMNRDNFGKSFADLINSAINTINVYDDF